MKYVFFIDIDGTLTSSAGIPQKNKDAMSKARKNGHLMFLNTGRSLGFIPRFVLAEAELDGIVAGSGTYLSIGEEVLQSGRMADDLLKTATAFLIEHDRKFMLEGERFILFHNHRIDHERFFEIKSADELDEKFKDVVIEKINISGTLDPDEREFMSGILNTVCHSDYAECAPKGCDKGNGLRTIMRHLGEGYRSVAIGDSANDVDMLRAADISVAMGNSSREIKEMCDVVTSTNEDGGVGDVIERIVSEKL